MRIRPFDFASDRDYEQFVVVYNTVWPTDHLTSEQLRFQDERLVPGYLHRRFVLEEKGRIIGSASTGQSPGSYEPGKYWLSIMVHPEARRQGHGSAGYAHLLALINRQEDKPEKLVSWTVENQNEGIRFLEKRGFERRMRYPMSKLDVAAFDAGRFTEKVNRIRQSKLTIKTLADQLVEDPDCKIRLYDAFWEMLQDVPLPDPLTRYPFEVWERRVFESPTFLPEGWFIAFDGDEIAGLTQLHRCGKEDRLETGLTGVRRPYRRCGLATTLKVMAIQFASEQGYTEIVTDNEENNPMFQINLQLGFEPLPANLDFAKYLKRPDRPGSI